MRLTRFCRSAACCSCWLFTIETTTEISAVETLGLSRSKIAFSGDGLDKTEACNVMKPFPFGIFNKSGLCPGIALMQSPAKWFTENGAILWGLDDSVMT